MGGTYTNIRKEVTEEVEFIVVLKDLNGFAVRDSPDLAKSSLAISDLEEHSHKGK